MAGKGTEAGKLYLGLHLNSKPIQSQMTAMQGKLQNSFSGIGSSIGKMLVGALSVTAITAFSKKCLELGSDLAEVQNVVDVTFNSMNESVNRFAQDAAANFGLSETMAKRFTGTFGAMAKAFGFSENAAYDMSTSLTGLAGDVASFYNIDQDAAYTKLKSVFTGETESLKDLGVVMTQTALDQFALQNGFGKTTSAMTEQEKVALRYQFVMSQLSTASGDFARTSDSWANQVRMLKLQFDSLCGVIGQTLIAALTPAIKALNSFMTALVKAANTFKAFVFSLMGKTSEDMAAGSGAAADGLDDMASSAGDAASGVSGVGDAVSGAAQQIKRSLAGFDQITKLTDQASSGGSGSGSGSSGAGSGIASSLGDTSSALKSEAYSFEGSPLMDFAASIRMTISDVFGDWGDWSAEKIMERVIFAIPTLTGAVAGGMVGGLPGVLIGAGVGATLGILADSIIFDHDGVMSKNEILDSISLGLNAVAGAALGFAVSGGNIVGALIGASVFVALDVGLRATVMRDENGIIVDSDGNKYKSLWAYLMVGVLGFPSDQEIAAWAEGVREKLANAYTLVTAWFNDNFVRGLDQMIIDDFNEVLDALNTMIASAAATLEGTWLGDKLGDFHFNLIPNLDPPVGTFYNQTKAAIEAESQKDPVQTEAKANLTGVGFARDWTKPSVYATASLNTSNLAGSWTKPSVNTTAALETVGFTRNWTRPSVYTTASLNDHSFASTWKIPWAYTTAYFNDYYNSGKGMPTKYLATPWAYATAYFNTYGLSSYWKKPWMYATAYFNKAYALSKGAWVQCNADGGVFTNGKWSAIQQYASGGMPGGGQLFVAREAGPELVGTLGGHTAVMNNDQIVASVSAGVARAIAGIKFYSRERSTPHLAVIGASLGRSEEHLSQLAQRAAETAAAGGTAQVIELLKQILAALQDMDRDVYLDGKSVKDRIVELINRNTRATGVCEIMV